MPRGKILAQTSLTIIFLATLGFFCLGTIFSEKKDISFQEKRQLASFPQIPSSKALLMAWPKSLTEYLKDQFFYREDLVFLNALMRVKLFQRSPTFVVLAGVEGWYFFMGDWALHDFLRKPEKTDAALTRSWENLIAHRQQMLQEIGANYLVAVAPNKECLYPEFLPKRIEEKIGTSILQVMNDRMSCSPLADHFLDLTEPLRKAKSPELLYFKTDSHWNSRGAYFAYRAIMEKIKLWYPQIAPLPENSFAKRPLENTQNGDLVLLMGLIGSISEKVEEWDVRPPCTTLEDRTITSERLPAGQSLQANGCPAGADQRVLVISDSFGEGIKKYMSATFQDVVYSRELNVPDLRGFINEYRFDLVLDLRVARYLPKVMSPGRDEKNY